MRKKLWFDVGIKRYTTAALCERVKDRLWFDVGIKRYTTLCFYISWGSVLWFDVGIKRYTTNQCRTLSRSSCGLM